ncbi:LOW QUALITY PROTEIN: hypothetical protein MAR_005728, partial [Mya arenaria]
MLEKLAYVRLKIVDSPNPNILMEKIMCGVDRYDCAYGHCKECANRKMPTTNEYTEAVAATKILKERYIKHVFNIKHQYREFKNMKDNLCESGCIFRRTTMENSLKKYRRCISVAIDDKFLSILLLFIATWNFTETGHGKSAADGVGGTVKRTADRIVANGKTINDATALFENVRSVIEEYSNRISGSLKTVKGTMKLHQVLISTKHRSIINGHLHDLDAESVEVKCMARIGHSRYFWSRIDDIIWYTWNHVMMPIPEPSHVRGRHCQIDPEKFKAIEAV